MYVDKEETDSTWIICRRYSGYDVGSVFLKVHRDFTKSCIVNVRQKITTSFLLMIRQQRYPQSNWLWIFNRENDYMKKIKYITAVCMMICIIMQLHTNVSANENNICYVAHRGYTKYAPENSIPAFEAAGREGFQAVECDIHETAKDKKGKRRFVIMHDQTLNRMCGLSGKNVYQKKLTYKKIRSKYHIKTGNNIESYTKKQLRIPSLEEYLSICKRYHMKPVIEIKQKMKKDTIKRLYQSLKKAKMQDQAVVTCKYKQQLTYMRKYAHKMPLEYVRHDFTQNDLSWMKKYHINVSIDKNILSDDMIQLFETNNIKINIWTINNKDQLYNFTNKGIKIVTSDDILWKE